MEGENDVVVDSVRVGNGEGVEEEDWVVRVETGEGVEEEDWVCEGGDR